MALRGDNDLMKISVQLWTVRRELEKDPRGTLTAIREMGFRYVETAGTAGLKPNQFAEIVDAVGLKVSGMHVGLEDCEKDLPSLLDLAGRMNCQFLIVPWAPESSYKDGWDKLGVRLQAIGEKVSAAKRKFAYHNHTFEFQDVGGRTGYDVLMAAACPDYVKCQIDLWWANCGGQNVPQMLARYKERVDLVHLKDGADCKDSVHREAGRGIMKWDPILEACRKAGVEWGVVELDECPNPPLESIRTCLEFFRSRGFKD